MQRIPSRLRVCVHVASVAIGLQFSLVELQATAFLFKQKDCTAIVAGEKAEKRECLRPTSWNVRKTLYEHLEKPLCRADVVSIQCSRFELPSP
jgi:hypothetical protein